MRYCINALYVCLLLSPLAGNGQQIEALLVNKYWQYSSTIQDKSGNRIYNFNTIPGSDSIKEIAMYFEKNGSFREVTNKLTHPKPARNGKWHVSNDTLVLDFPNQRWNYKILFMSGKEFQCSMSTSPRPSP